MLLWFYIKIKVFLLTKIRHYTVTRATQNEALLWKIAVLRMKKPHVGDGTFFPCAYWYFTFFLAGKYLLVSGARPSPCCYKKTP
jgi:hypothetical protein